MKRKIRVAHAITGYTCYLLLLFSPVIWSFEEKSLLVIVSSITSGAGILLNLLCRHEAGIFKLIPFRNYLNESILLNLFIFFAPTICGYLISGPYLFISILLLATDALAYKIHFVKKRKLAASW
jgi:hypothetical protein